MTEIGEVFLGVDDKTQVVRNYYQEAMAFISGGVGENIVEDKGWTNLVNVLDNIRWIDNNEIENGFNGIDGDGVGWFARVNSNLVEGSGEIKVVFEKVGSLEKINISMVENHNLLIMAGITSSLKNGNTEMGFKEWEYSLSK